jgi:hypothetical protein
VSSAKSRVREINFSAISLIYIINNRGTSTDAWGTTAHQLLEMYNCILNSPEKKMKLAVLYSVIFLKHLIKFGIKG